MGQLVDDVEALKYSHPIKGRSAFEKILGKLDADDDFVSFEIKVSALARKIEKQREDSDE